MMRSLYSGVAGLKTHQTRMDVIGNNIANVNTTAYKSQSMTFSDLMYQTTQSASGANATTGVGGTNARQIGLGAKTSAIKTAITTQGASQTTNDPFDMMITGSNFFVVSNGQENLFTRDGSFYVDGAGNLCMTSTGYNVMGWTAQVDADGKTAIKQDTVKPLKIMSAEYMTYPPEATSKGELAGIIDSNDKDINADGQKVTFDFYDNLGYKYTAKFSIKAAADGTTTIDGKSVATKNYTMDLVSVTTVVKTDAGDVSQEVLTKKDPDTNKDVPDLDKYKTAFPSATITFNATDGTIVGVSGGSPKQTATEPKDKDTDFRFNPQNLGLASFTDQTIKIDASSLTNFNNNGSCTTTCTRGDKDGDGSGRKIGEMSGVSIQKDGMIYATYDNGQSRLLGQIATASFANPSGLAKQGDNLYSATQNSGDFDGIGVDVTLGGGYMNSGVLEMSNVDLSSEFTEMITTQRGFQANSRIITVSDTLLEELTNLKR